MRPIVEARRCPPFGSRAARRARVIALVVASAFATSCAPGEGGPNPLPPEPIIQARVSGCGLVGTQLEGLPVGAGMAVHVIDATASTVLATGATDADGCYSIDVFTQPLEVGARFQVEGRAGGVPLRAMLLERAGDARSFRADWSVSTEVCTLAVVASLEGGGRTLDSLSPAEVLLVRAVCELVARAESEAETPAQQIEEVVEVTVGPAESPVRGLLGSVGIVPAPEDLVDPDGDGVPTDGDSCPRSPDATQADGDGDGVGDLCDTCPETYDPEQLDSDGDGFGDACDERPFDFDEVCDAGQSPCGELTDPPVLVETPPSGEPPVPEDDPPPDGTPIPGTPGSLSVR